MSDDVSRLLAEVSAGKDGAYDELMPRVYAELREIARRKMAGERSDHTLSATALVHEAYVRLVKNDRIVWRDRAHFYGAAAESMKRILIDRARKLKGPKAGGGRKRMPLSVVDLALEFDPSSILELTDALRKLDQRMVQVVEMRFFAGLSVSETASALGVSDKTVKRDWTTARAWLFRALGGTDSDARNR